MSRSRWLVAFVAVTAVAAVSTSAVIASDKPRPKSSAQVAAEKAAADRKREAAQLAASEFVTVRKAVRPAFPKWSGTTLDGKPWTNTSLSGGITVVNFWASWCGPCEEEWPALQKVATSRTDIAFVGINTMDRESSAKEFLVKHPSDYPQVFDERGVIIASWKTIPHGVLPTTVIVDRNGKIAAWKGGPLTAAQLLRGIKAVIAAG